MSDVRPWKQTNVIPEPPPRQMSGCKGAVQRYYERVITAAFLQASREAGLPDHPGGECPEPNCRCKELANSIEAQAIKLAAAQLGVNPALLKEIQ